MAKLVSPVGPELGCQGIRHLLVVAGASGAGKSTFVELLTDGRLPDEVRSKLPSGSEKWKRLKGGEQHHWLSAVIEESKHREIPGLVLDYDLVRKVALRGNFDNDPALKILKLAKKVTVVNLRPSVECVVNQLIYRELGARGKKRRKIGIRAAILFRYAIVPFVRALPSSFVVRIKQRRIVSLAWNAVYLPKNLTRKLSCYEKSGWLEELYERWQTFLRLVVSEEALIQQIFLEPDRIAQVGEIYCWRPLRNPGEVATGVSIL